ncbi:MAG: TatD family hydrolase [Candidatus Pacebacteria bacterium]|nr:TatD family hydrolase [Candidatus Paceibacterota bacterium]MCF7856877.1 TatD family hydrolase [Candidatus Paceibacterota bacterium]
MTERFRYIDIHTHLNLEAFDKDGKEVGERTRDTGVSYINIGTGLETSKKAVVLAHEASGVYATVGIHPTHTVEEGGGENFTYDDLMILAGDEKVVAIGECGLDYFRVSKDGKEIEEGVFIKHIELANEFNKPLMLHIRSSERSMDAYEDALGILKAHAKILGNVHFFAGTYDIAKQFWDIGFSTSFTGVITFANQYDEVIRNAPLNMIHAETDAPYVAPVPYRGKRNEPLFVKEVYRRIAEIRGENEEEVRKVLVENAKKLFNIEF